MRTHVLSRWPLVVFLFAAAVIISIGYLLTGSEAYRSHNGLFQFAITVDIALVVPFLFYLTIRKTTVPVITLVPVFLVCVALASWVLPRDGQRFVEFVKWSFIPLELFITGYLIWSVRRAMTSFHAQRLIVPDFPEQLYKALLPVFGQPRLAHVFATEIGVIRYGIFGWRDRKEAGAERAFTYHVRCGYGAIMSVFYFLIALETVFLHMLIVRWSITGAWILTALSIYGLIFLFADRNAIRRRPILLDGSTLHVRIGLRWRVEIPLEAIIAVRMISASEKRPAGAAKLVLIGTENVALDLDRELVATGLYGIKRPFTQLRLSMDDKEEFVKAITALKVGL